MCMVYVNVITCFARMCHVELVSGLDISLHVGEAGFYLAKMLEQCGQRKTIRVRGISFFSFVPAGNCLKDGKTLKCPCVKEKC